MASADFAAILPASALVASRKSATGTTWLTSPSDFAVAALMKSPVSSIYIPALRTIARESATIGVEQNSPTLILEVANRASSLATARSQLARSWQPGGG